MQRLTLRQRLESSLQLTGVFGVFHQGRAELAWLDSTGATLATLDCGAVSPNAVHCASSSFRTGARTGPRPAPAAALYER